MIRIYGHRDCVVCRYARKLCQDYGEDFEYFDRSIRKFYLECVEGQANMDVTPNVFVNEKYIGDYTSLLTYLKEKRYGSKE